MKILFLQDHLLKQGIMKQNLLFFLALLFSGALFGQVISISEVSLSVVASTDVWDVVGHSSVKNVSGATIELQWVREVNDLANGWASAVCDNNQCYPDNISTNVVPNGNPNIPVVLAPGQSSIIDIHVYPAGSAGEGDVQVCLYEVGSTDQLGCIDVNYKVEPVNAVDVVDKASIKIFPNPTADYFGLLNTNGVGKVRLFNMLGRSVRNFDVTTGKKYYIGDLPAGMYLAAIHDRSGNVIKTTRVVKRFIAP